LSLGEREKCCRKRFRRYAPEPLPPSDFCDCVNANLVSGDINTDFQLIAGPELNGRPTYAFVDPEDPEVKLFEIYWALTQWVMISGENTAGTLNNPPTTDTCPIGSWGDLSEFIISITTTACD